MVRARPAGGNGRTKEDATEPKETPPEEPAQAGAPARLPRRIEELPPLTGAAARRFLAHLKPHAGAGAGMAAFTVLTILLGVPLPWLGGAVLDHALIPKNASALWILVLATCGLTLLAAAARVAQAVFQVRFRQGVAGSLRAQVLRHTLTLPPSFFDSEETGYLMSRVTGDVMQVESLLSTQAFHVVLDAVKLLGGTILLFGLNWRLTLLSAAVVPLYLLAVVLFRRRVRDASNDLMESLGLYFKALQEALAGVGLMKSFGRGAGEAARPMDRLEGTFGPERRTVALSSLSSAFTAAVTAVGMAAVLAAGGLEVIAGRATVGELFAFLGYLGLLFGPSRSLAYLPVQIQPALVALRRVLGLLRLAPEPRGGIRPERIAGDIRFEGVTFAYGPGRNVLEDLSLAVRAGERLGIRGATGAGKSTLLKILLGYYPPSAGRVTVDGLPVSDLDPGELRSRMGYLPQDAFFFGDTVEGNLRWAAPRATEAELADALEAAEAAAFVEGLPQGLQTVLGEGGKKLSGGEKQRLAAARALLARPDVLVMDEATSFLDPETEARLLGALARRFEGRTLILVSHRSTALERMERVVTLRGGRIVAGE